jgi:Lrp/AsnC family transcriptional regulator, leucine-responsive regulatory protein
MRPLDAIDRRILRELAKDARISNVKLAERVELSQSACLRRVQDLEKGGVLLGYRARLSRKHLGRHLVAYVMVGLSTQKKSAHQAFERVVTTAREVVECHNVTGRFEYLLRVEVSDLDAYKSFHTDVLGGLPDVSVLTSYIVMASPKDDRE